MYLALEGMSLGLKLLPDTVQRQAGLTGCVPEVLALVGELYILTCRQQKGTVSH